MRGRTSSGIIALQDNKAITLTANGTTEVTPDSGKKGMKKTTVTVAVPMQANKAVTITSNGTHVINPDSGNTAMKKTTAVVAVPIQASKGVTLTTNGGFTITPDAGNVAMGSVFANVAIPGNAFIGENIIARSVTAAGSSGSFGNIPVTPGKYVFLTFLHATATALSANNFNLNGNAFHRFWSGAAAFGYYVVAIIYCNNSNLNITITGVPNGSFTSMYGYFS